MGFMRHKRKIILLVVICSLLGTGFFTGKKLFLGKQSAYLTAIATKMDIEESVIATGVLKPYLTVDVGAQVSGQIKKLYVHLGDQVKKGQLLAQIDPILQQNSLRDAEATLENALSQKRSKLAMLRQYELAYKRQTQLIAESIVSRADLENSEALFDSTRADLLALDALIKRAEISVDIAKANLSYTQILAPIDGIVISIVTEEGQTVVSAQTAPTILKLAKLDTITVKALISEADIIRVKPGMTVYFTILGDPETRHFSKLRAIEPAPESTNSSSSSGSISSNSAIYYNGLFDIPNPDKKLRALMTAQVTILLHKSKQVLCIPASTLGDKDADGSYTVKVLRNNLPETRKIRVGINNNVKVQVIDGLSEGDKVIIGDTSSFSSADKTQPGPQTRKD